MKRVNFQSKNGQSITISAPINFPQGFEESKQYPAIAARICGYKVRSILLTPEVSVQDGTLRNKFNY